VSELKRVPIKAIIDGRVVELSVRALNYEKLKRAGCKPMVYPRGLCCEEPNPIEWVEVCDRVRLSSLLDREPMIPMIERARDFFKALLNPRRVRLIGCSPSRTMCVVWLDGVEHNILVYRKKGFWSLGYSYAAKIAAEKWCERMYRRECELYHGAVIIAAILEDYILYLRPMLPEILIPDQDWVRKAALYSIKTNLHL